MERQLRRSDCTQFPTVVSLKLNVSPEFHDAVVRFRVWVRALQDNFNNRFPEMHRLRTVRAFFTNPHDFDVNDAPELCETMRVERATFENELLKLQAEGSTASPFTLAQWRTVKFNALRTVACKTLSNCISSEIFCQLIN